MGNRDVAKQGTHGREEGATGLPRLDYLASVSMYLLEQDVLQLSSTNTSNLVILLLLRTHKIG